MHRAGSEIIPLLQRLARPLAEKFDLNDPDPEPSHLAALERTPIDHVGTEDAQVKVQGSVEIGCLDSNVVNSSDFHGVAIGTLHLV